MGCDSRRAQQLQGGRLSAMIIQDIIGDIITDDIGDLFGGGVPSTALTLDAAPLLLDGNYLTLGDS